VTIIASRRQVDRDPANDGSSAQRQEWFTTGHRTGDPNACDTFA
jgi:predicted metalloprotease